MCTAGTLHISIIKINLSDLLMELRISALEQCTYCLGICVIINTKLICESCIQYTGIKYYISSRGNKE